MYPVKKEHYNHAADFIQHVEADKVYPLSITDGLQTGEIFVNDVDRPSCCLYWHYCGFAFLAGEYDEAFICEIKEKMHDPTEKHSGRLALETGNDRKPFYASFLNWLKEALRHTTIIVAEGNR